MQNLAFKIRRMLERLNFTQEFVAAQLDISIKTYQRIESGKTQLSLSQVLLLTRAFGVSLKEFLPSDELFETETVSGILPATLKTLQQENSYLSERLQAVREEKERLLGIIERLVSDKG